MSEMKPDILDILSTTICQSSFDWAQDKYHAFIYGVVVGWGPDACEELAQSRILNKADIERMNLYHGILNTRAPQEPKWQPIETAKKHIDYEITDGSYLVRASLQDVDFNETSDCVVFGWVAVGGHFEYNNPPTHFRECTPIPAPPEVTYGR